DLHALLLEHDLRDVRVGGRTVPRIDRERDRAAQLRPACGRRPAGATAALATAAARCQRERQHRDPDDDPPLAVHAVSISSSTRVLWARRGRVAVRRVPRTAAAHPWEIRSSTTASATIATPASTPSPSSLLVRP